MEENIGNNPVELSEWQELGKLVGLAVIGVSAAFFARKEGAKIFDGGFKIWNNRKS